MNECYAVRHRAKPYQCVGVHILEVREPLLEGLPPLLGTPRLAHQAALICNAMEELEMEQSERCDTRSDGVISALLTAHC